MTIDQDYGGATRGEYWDVTFVCRADSCETPIWDRDIHWFNLTSAMSVGLLQFHCVTVSFDLKAFQLVFYP